MNCKNLSARGIVSFLLAATLYSDAPRSNEITLALHDPLPLQALRDFNPEVCEVFPQFWIKHPKNAQKRANALLNLFEKEYKNSEGDNQEEKAGEAYTKHIIPQLWSLYNDFIKAVDSDWEKVQNVYLCTPLDKKYYFLHAQPILANYFTKIIFKAVQKNSNNSLPLLHSIFSHIEDMQLFGSSLRTINLIDIKYEHILEFMLLYHQCIANLDQEIANAEMAS